MTNSACLIDKFESGDATVSRARAISDQPSRRGFLGIMATLFAVTTVLTIVWCGPMSAMGGMPMPGGWTMSMAWMRMPGQSWVGATVSFVAMWVVMMTAMMLPSLSPMLWRYRQSLAGAGEMRQAWLITLAGLGYIFMWTLFGLAVFPSGVAMATVEMQHPALARMVPIATGFIVVIAGALQFTKWKANQLSCCREAPAANCVLPAQAGAAWRQGLRLGLHCGLSCGNLTAVLLVLGVMDFRVMAAVTAAIIAERLAPAAEHVVRAIGVLVLAIGLLSIVSAVGLG